MITAQQLRWLLLVIAGGLITFIVVRRRQEIAEALPEQIVSQAERFVIPWTSLERVKSVVTEADDEAMEQDAPLTSTEEEEPEGDEASRRKVSRRYRISYAGKQYGPLPEALVGQYVEVEARDGKLFVLHEGQPIANFTLQS
jgi:hypothetical protein